MFARTGTSERDARRAPTRARAQELRVGVFEAGLVDLAQRLTSALPKPLARLFVRSTQPVADGEARAAQPSFEHRAKHQERSSN